MLEQLDDPAADTVLVAQLEHEDEPIDEEKWPAAHEEQDPSLPYQPALQLYTFA